ncbi:MAG TPA: UDP-N-acetylglucosamine 2-epimerase (non-hydrolyzing) [Gemmatimonadales bacterium]|nr:UDP-N-acetylglucosamine 2-epimerase (non-hydrolyzing) [Gemmatimonadales bacterium]
MGGGGTPGTLLSVVGARPNFMKLAPVARAAARRPAVRHVIVHTGQHYDAEMSDTFFQELGIPRPDHNLEVGSGSHATQTALIMQRFEPVCLEVAPAAVVVYGDVNSTVAAALVAAKLGVKVAHVEAGLRSRDWTMPEEINRVVTDRLADWLLAPSRDAVDNLRAEGVPAERVHLVGNVMIDSLVASLPRARASRAAARHGVDKGPFVLVTLHRPNNVDAPATLRVLLDTLGELARRMPVVFPVHPRTRGRIAEMGWTAPPGAALKLLDPIPYLETLSLEDRAALVVTDSGGLQEETTFLGVPCLTVRPSTERPITCTEGTNRLVKAERDAILEAAGEALRARRPVARPIERWDGHTADRILEVLVDGAGYRV